MKNESQVFFENVLNQLKDIQTKHAAILSEINAVQQQSYILAELVSCFLNNPLYVKKNALIVRSINSYLKTGLNLDQAMLKTSERLCESFRRCQVVYNLEKNHEKVLKQYAIRHMVLTLAKNGFSKRQIAKICGFSEKYLYDFIKKNKEKQR